MYILPFLLDDKFMYSLKKKVKQRSVEKEIGCSLNYLEHLSRVRQSNKKRKRR